MSESDSVEWQPLSLADQVRHEHLFYSQEPVEGYLSAEKARDLFLLSKLPLLKLSQIWNLADTGKDNMLDVTEFTVAMHLIQGLLQGKNLPKALPDFLQFPPVKPVSVPVLEDREKAAYEAVFATEDQFLKGFIDGKCGYPIFVGSCLPLGEISLIWDLADHDANGTLDKDEFTVACHLLKYAKEGNKIEGPVNFLSLAPTKALPGTLLSKKRRLAVMEKQKTSLMALKERRKNQAERENKRSELKKEKVKLAIQKHKLFKVSGNSESSSGFQEKLQQEQEKVKHLEAVAVKLKKEHEKVRQQTVKIILDEQKLSAEVNKQEAEVKRVTQMLSLSKEHKVVHDLDPFHQLYEQRKEAKENGKESPATESKVEIPFVFNPFDKDSFEKPRIKGEDIFNLRKQAEAEATWGGTVRGQMCNDYGFDDNFVNTWAPREVTTTLDDVFGEEETVFKTVPVSMDEDELWCSIPDLTVEDMTVLNQQWDTVKSQELALSQEGEQLVFKNPADYNTSPAEEDIESRVRTRPSYNRRSYAGVTPQRIGGEFAEPLDRFAKYRRRSANSETLRKEANDISETPVRDRDFKYSRRKFRSEEDLLADDKDTSSTARSSTLQVNHLDPNERSSRKYKSEENINAPEPSSSLLIQAENEITVGENKDILIQSEPEVSEQIKKVDKDQPILTGTSQETVDQNKDKNSSGILKTDIQESILPPPVEISDKIQSSHSDKEIKKQERTPPTPAPRTSLKLQLDQGGIKQDSEQAVTKEVEPKLSPVAAEYKEVDKLQPVLLSSPRSDEEAKKPEIFNSSDLIKHPVHFPVESGKVPIKPDRPKRKAKLQKLQKDSLGSITSLGSGSSSPTSTSPSLSPSPSPLFLNSSTSYPMKTPGEEKDIQGQSAGSVTTTSKATTYVHIVSPPKFTTPGGASQTITWKSVGYLPASSPTKEFHPPVSLNTAHIDSNAKEDEIVPQISKSRVEAPAVSLSNEETTVSSEPAAPEMSKQEKDMENAKACRDELANLRAQFFADMEFDQNSVHTLVTMSGQGRVRSSGSVSEDEIQPVSLKRKALPVPQKYGEDEEEPSGVDEGRVSPIILDRGAPLPDFLEMEGSVEEEEIQPSVAQRKDISHLDQVGDITLLPVEHMITVEHVVQDEAAPCNDQLENGSQEETRHDPAGPPSNEGSNGMIVENLPIARSHSPISIEEEPISPVAFVKKDPTIFLDNTLNLIVNGNEDDDNSLTRSTNREEERRVGMESFAELWAADSHNGESVKQNGGPHTSNAEHPLSEEEEVDEDHIIQEVKVQVKPEINFPLQTGIPSDDNYKNEEEPEPKDNGDEIHNINEYFAENQCKSVPDLTELDEPMETIIAEVHADDDSHQKTSEYFPENQCKSVPDLTELDEPVDVVLTANKESIEERGDAQQRLDEYFPENQCMSVPDLTELDSPPAEKMTDTSEYFSENQCKSIPDLQAMNDPQNQTDDDLGINSTSASSQEEYFPENQCRSIPDLVGLGEMKQPSNEPHNVIIKDGQKPAEVVSPPLSPKQPAKFILGGDDDSSTRIPPDVISVSITQNSSPSVSPKAQHTTRAIDKAMEIAKEVEPQRVFHKEEVVVPTSGQNELEKERKQLISQMKVRRKKVATWKGVTESPPPPPTVDKPMTSMRKYEERKKQLQKQQPDVIPKVKAQGEVESQSISDQNLTKKHWEEKLAEEQEKKNSHRTPQKQNNNDWEYDNRFREEESLESDDGPKYRDDMIQYEKKVKSPEPDSNDIYANESAIDREIRLATEREEHLRKERETRLLEAQQKSGGSHGTQPKPPAAKQQTPHVVRSPVKEDGRIATGDSPSSTSKMSLEYSTVEEDTEATEKRVGYEKEQQQSEFERQEKEEEKLSAHESIVEREIRLQREREEIIARERERAYQQKREEAKKNKSEPAAPKNPHKDKNPSTSSGSLKLHINSPAAPSPFVPPVAPSPMKKNAASPMAEGKQFAHPGESLIARELREQREREEEILRLRRQMSNSQGKASDCGDTEEVDAKSVDVPQQPSGTWQKEVKPFKKEGYSHCANSTDSAHSTGTNTSYSALHACSAQNEAITVTSPRSPKVRPFQDVEQEHSYKYVPQQETPIERDIRIAREREEELRKIHSLPKIPPPAEREVVIIEKEAPQKPPADKADQTDAHNGVTLRTKSKGNPPNTQEKFTFRKSQNLTENKIHQELEEMQQREEELKKQRQANKQVTEKSPSKKSDDKTDGHSEKTAAPQTVTAHSDSNEGSNTLKRRSRLAQEWEDKFGKS